MLSYRRLSYRRFSFFISVLFIFAFVLCGVSFPQNQKPEIKPYKQLYNNGYVNWTDGIVVAKGIAPYPEKKDLASARALSKLAARKDCQRKLLATVLEINVDDEQKVENLIKTNKEIKINLDGIVKDAVVTGEESDDNAKISSVIMQSPLWGIGGIITVFLKNKDKVLENKFEEGRIEKFDFEKFEGLVIDARNLRVDPALFPKVVDENGNVIYDKNLPDVKDLYKKGMIRYITTTKKDFEYIVGRDFHIPPKSVGGNHPTTPKSVGREHRFPPSSVSVGRGLRTPPSSVSVGREHRFPPSLAACGNAALQCRNSTAKICIRPFKLGNYLSSVFFNLKAYAEKTEKIFVKALKSTGKLSANLILENRIALKVNKLKITDKYLTHCNVVVIVSSGVRGEKLSQDKFVSNR